MWKYGLDQMNTVAKSINR